MKKRILIVEDNTDLSKLLTLHLTDQLYGVTCESHGERGYRQALKGEFDLIILDIMLPGMDGMDVLRHIRQAGKNVPILMLTSKSTEMDRVLGLELGADDYVTKPFSIRELLARVKAMFRRMESLSKPQTKENDAPLSAGNLALDPEKRTVEISGISVDLTAKEFDLLFHFASHPGRAYSRSQLLDTVWGYAHSGYEHTVNSHINRLRAKIEEDPANPRYILTVWGVGYKFTDEFSP